MDEAAAARHKLQLHAGVLGELAAVTIAALMATLWMGVRDWVTVGAVIVLTAAAAAMKLVAARRIERPKAERYAYAAYLLNVLAVLGVGRGFGPLLFMPLVLGVITHLNATTHRRWYRVAVVVTACVAQLAAVAVEVAGILPRSYEFHDGALTILPRVVQHAELPTITALTMSSLFMLIVPAWMMGRFQRALREAERRSFVQAWQLRQLLPEAPRTGGIAAAG
jgi:serine/threonine-protein kinase